MKITNGCFGYGTMLRTIIFKNKRWEQYYWMKEGNFIVKKDMTLKFAPIISKYKIK